MRRTTPEQYWAAIRREQDRRNPHRVTARDGVIIPLPALRSAPFTGTAGI